MHLVRLRLRFQPSPHLKIAIDPTKQNQLEIETLTFGVNSRNSSLSHALEPNSNITSSKLWPVPSKQMTRFQLDSLRQTHSYDARNHNDSHPVISSRFYCLKKKFFKFSFPLLFHYLDCVLFGYIWIVILVVRLNVDKQNRTTETSNRLDDNHLHTFIISRRTLIHTKTDFLEIVSFFFFSVLDENIISHVIHFRFGKH